MTWCLGTDPWASWLTAQLGDRDGTSAKVSQSSFCKVCERDQELVGQEIMHDSPNDGWVLVEATCIAGRHLTISWTEKKNKAGEWHTESLIWKLLTLTFTHLISCNLLYKLLSYGKGSQTYLVHYSKCRMVKAFIFSLWINWLHCWFWI